MNDNGIEIVGTLTREQLILEVFKEMKTRETLPQPNFTTREFVDRTGFPDDIGQAGKMLMKLVEKGVLAREKIGPWNYYWKV